MKKRILAILMALAVSICMVPSMSFAEGSEQVVKTSFIAHGTAYSTSIKLKWSEVKNASTYKVYFVKCGKEEFKKVKSTTRLTFTKKHLKKGEAYKAYVAAYDESGKKIARTPNVHIITKGGSKSNATSVSAKSKVSIDVGKTVKVNAKISKKDGKKPLFWKHHVRNKIRYYSADKSIATVSAKGVVKGAGAGTVNIYSVAASGVCKVTKVTVTKPEPTFIIDSDSVGYYYSTDGGATWTGVFTECNTELYSRTVKIRFADVTILVNGEEVGTNDIKTFTKGDETETITVRRHFI